MNLKIVFFSLMLPANAVYPQLVGSNKQVSMSKYNIPTANYSGITRIDKEHYALVSDKEPYEGFYVFKIVIDTVTGNLKDITSEGFKGDTKDTQLKSIYSRDSEGIAWCASLKTLLISGEADQQILEYQLDGKPTGRKLNVPAHFGINKIQSNCGFEALTYNETTQKIWTTTERALNADKNTSTIRSEVGDLLRLQSFDIQFNPLEQYYYQTDAPSANKRGKYYAFGVSALAALPNDALLVMEREFYVAKKYIGSWVKTKIYQVKPTVHNAIATNDTTLNLNSNKILVKQLVTQFTTRLNLLKHTLANYEGMCLGPILKDGRQTLLLINDSQGGAGHYMVHLKDYIKVLVLETEQTKTKTKK